MHELDPAKKAASSDKRLLILELHHQHEITKPTVEITKPKADYLEIMMDIRPSGRKEQAKGHLGSIKLHYLELPPFARKNNDEVCLHRPFLWSIDVSATKDQSAGVSTAPINIIHYAVSGNSKYVATLSLRDKDLWLDVWHSPNEQHEMVQTPAAQEKMTMSDAVSVMVSISMDASQITLTADKMFHSKSSFHHFELKVSQPPDAGEETPTSSGTLSSVQVCAELREFKGYGKFHSTDTRNTDTKNEVFIACDKSKVIVFSVDTWSWNYTIDFYYSPMDHPKRVIEELRARYFAWIDKELGVSVYDLDTGKLLWCEEWYSNASIPDNNPTYTTFSEDGSLLAYRRKDQPIVVRYTKTGAELVTETLPKASSDKVMWFVKNNTRLVIPDYQRDSKSSKYGQGHLSMVMDSTTLSTTDLISIPIHCKDSTTLSTTDPTPIPMHCNGLVRPRSTGTCGEKLYLPHGSKLDLIRLQDVTVPPFPQPRSSNTNNCSECKKPSNDKFIVGPSQTGKWVVPESGLTFSVGVAMLKQERGDDHAVVKVSNSHGKERECLRFPKPGVKNEEADYWIKIDGTSQQMIVLCSQFVMVWKLPMMFEEEFHLRLVWWSGDTEEQTPEPGNTKEQVPESGNIKEQAPERGGTQTPKAGDTGEQTPEPGNTKPEDTKEQIRMTHCIHGFYHIVQGESNFSISHYTDAFGSEPNRFFKGMLVLVGMYEHCNDTLQKHILQYVGHYINRHDHSDGDKKQTVLSRICENVKQENYAPCRRFLEDLLAHARWIPIPEFSMKLNPIKILLHGTASVPRAIGLVETILDYCMNRARAETEYHFLLPVLDSLRKLIKAKSLHPYVVQNTLRRLAYFPVPVRMKGFIVDRAIIAYPPRWKFWQPNTTPIYECDDPVMQLNRSPGRYEHKPKNDNFTREVFVATFTMLWRVKSASVNPTAKRATGASQARMWIRTIFDVLLVKLKIKTNAVVKCHDFSLESMENPAIAALIEYKWNTVGYIYWLARFLWQCLYYLLVLVAVFFQVYSDQRESITGVFIAIAAMAGTFLWLEVLQMINNPSQYFSSPYNLVDFIVFALPLGGSVCQIINIMRSDPDGNTATLSFSVLFIFLHFLFELRISRPVCQFVTIIIHIVSKIRVFFLIFATGVLAFTVAILHLLRGCAGGVWDPIQNDFKSDNWAFHTMMILYFFFTTILLLNVLIALINVAFSDGEETWLLVWRQNRLRYIEAAEILTYHIPGLRETYDYFPEEIYYTATIQDLKNYHLKTSKKISEGSTGRSGGSGAGNGDINDGSSIGNTESLATYRMFGQGSLSKATASASVVKPRMLFNDMFDGQTGQRMISQEGSMSQHIQSDLNVQRDMPMVSVSEFNNLKVMMEQFQKTQLRLMELLENQNNAAAAAVVVDAPRKI
ncbi:hypothetical protein BGZ65_002685 [Modicella reniformis]|uniref:Ion transport domain-containing protein n=1 Tax=Modicella reniformis TaxID=1440133 RepID=A0A9P6STV4_9FUNG|nr:hypothetical protein BGZ65_002685 [Modicella reniformis]